MHALVSPSATLSWSRQNLLDPVTPRSSKRSAWFLPFWIVLCVVVLVMCFPVQVERVHCYLGLKHDCTSEWAAHRGATYNRAAIERSCAPSKETGKVVVVTGSAGFIGFWASLHLKERGDAVVGIDNFNDYYPVSLKHARAAELATAGIHTVRGDINDAAILQQVFEVCAGAQAVVCWLERWYYHLHCHDCFTSKC
jgi:GDP-mannose 4,6 dehydratase